ncbi:LOW QUALITY PROTEIN: Protocadherin gamma-B4, partial [Plecturocebus cupreus]
MWARTPSRATSSAPITASPWLCKVETTELRTQNWCWSGCWSGCWTGRKRGFTTWSSASDGGDPPPCGTARIQVTVVDVNDHAPLFFLPQYQVTVPENVPVGTRLLTIHAIDLDEGVNGEVTYSFRKITPKLLQMFHLNSLTGELSTLEGLDYEETAFYEMEVQAQGGPDSLTKTKVLITVLDMMIMLQNSIPEDTHLGTVIALFYLRDRDSGKNGEVTCTIPENLPFTLENSIDNYYRLVTTKNLDRETLSMYNVTLKATDGGTPPLSKETHISVEVAYTNDNQPTFPDSSYSVYIPENNPRGASIFLVTAQDHDSEENAQVTYSLAEDTIQGAPVSSYVSINSDTGVLYALQSFHSEQLRELQLRVTARDSGDPPLCSNMSLSLFVLDQNNNMPEILYPSLPTDDSTDMELAPRSAEPSYLVSKVVVVDKDSGQNAWLSYCLLKASQLGLFVMGLHMGKVCMAWALLDREALKSSLMVAIQDHSQPPLLATFMLTVAVADSIPKGLADLGSLEPSDSPYNSDLTLYLVVAVAAVSCIFLAFVIVLLAVTLAQVKAAAGSEGGLMSVPGSHFVGMDGVRAFLQTYSHEVPLTADSQKSHLIFPQPNYADTLISQENYIHECKDEVPSIQAGEQAKESKRDGELRGGGVRAEKRPGLFLFLLPLFCPTLSEQIRYRIPKEMPRGSVVGNLARDLGFSVQELLTGKLRVSSEKPYFTVSAESGNLLVSSKLDREKICRKNPTCALEFETVAETPLNFYQVNVEIEDINDHTPKFTQNSFELQISEEIRCSEYLELALKTPLDREKQKSYHLTLTALDFGAPPLHSTAQIRVLMTDANDNALVFSQDVYSVRLSENVYTGTTVLQVTATDQDEGVNAEITFSFSEASQITQFDLTSNTTEITVLNTLDFEDVKEYSIVLKARDSGGSIAQCTVEVDVIDENDNVPEMIFQSLPNLLIMEEAKLGTHIALLKVRDKDSKHNGEVTCKLEGDVLFKIPTSSRNTYKLGTDVVLDCEQNPEYNITITATDRDKPPLSCSFSISLHIGNSMCPRKKPPGASISQVSASYPDLGPNGQVSYSIVASDLEPRELSSYVSVSAQSRMVFTQCAFHHEQLCSFKLMLQACDHDSPALSANVSLCVLVSDCNDNTLQVLYPALGPDGSALFVTVPRTAEPGYMVTKMVVVDADSGHNAWLSYHVLQASEPGLFSLGLHMDEGLGPPVLLVAVSDGGQPPLSATTTLHLVFADSLQEVLPDITDCPKPSEPQAELQFYLAVALALISVLFLLATRHLELLPTWSLLDMWFPPNYSEETLPYSYNLYVAHTGKKEFNFLKCSEQMSSGQDMFCGNSSRALFPLCNSSESTSHPEL